MANSGVVGRSRGPGVRIRVLVRRVAAGGETHGMNVRRITRPDEGPDRTRLR